MGHTTWGTRAYLIVSPETPEVTVWQARDVLQPVRLYESSDIPSELIYSLIGCKQPLGEAGRRRRSMSEENRAPEDEQPLGRPVHEQRLARPVVREQEQTSQVEKEQAESYQEERQEARQVEEEQGLISKAIDKARERDFVDESTVEKAREKGLVDKADEAINRAMDKAREAGLVDKANEAIDKARNRLTGR